MSTAKFEFKRAILAFSCETYAAASLDAAAHLAEAMQVSLHGVFVMDEMLEAVAGYPGAREFITSSRCWRIIDQARIRDEQLEVAQGLQRRVMASTQAQGIKGSFEIISGRLAEALSDRATHSDILILPESPETFAAMTQTFARVLKAAVGSSAAVLFVPKIVELRGGGLVALAIDTGDPSIGLARAIAARTGETVKIVQLPASGGKSETGKETDAGPGTFDAIQPCRLIICSHHGPFLESGQLLKLLSSVRGTPVLLLEPVRPAEGPCEGDTRN